MISSTPVLLPVFRSLIASFISSNRSGGSGSKVVCFWWLGAKFPFFLHSLEQYSSHLSRTLFPSLRTVLFSDFMMSAVGLNVFVRFLIPRYKPLVELLLTLSLIFLPCCSIKFWLSIL